MPNKKYFVVSKDSNSQNIRPRMVVFDNITAGKIDTECIKFGLVHDTDGNPRSITIIERNGKLGSQINDRSVSNLVVNTPYVRRDTGMHWNNYTKRAYGKFLKKQQKETKKVIEAEKLDKIKTDFSALDETELEFLIEYLTMLLIKIKVESSKKLLLIKSKVK